MINQISKEENSNDIDKINKNIVTINKKDDNNEKLLKEFPLILINAKNQKNYYHPLTSNYIIDNYDYDEAIKYDKRSYCRIFFIVLIAKQNILNMFFINPPLKLKPIRICIFIFNFACDLALNALFYLSDNISYKYHYTGIYRELYVLVNNITISLTSAIVSFILLFFFESLTESTEKIKQLFRKQDNLLKKDENYKVSKKTKREIKNKIIKIMKCYRIKIIVFIILEFIFMIFFFHYVTAFCEVYKKTQINWFLDFVSSYLISLAVILGISIICSILYKLSILYKIKPLYKFIRYIY